MGDPLKPLTPGALIPTSIKTWNPMLAAARAHGNGSSRPPSGRPLDYSDNEVKLAQAPSGGIPKRTGITPGSAVCTQVILAPRDGTGFSKGDLVKTAKTFTVVNWDTTKAHAVDGDRVFQVSKHASNALIVSVSCENSEDPADIVLFE